VDKLKTSDWLMIAAGAVMLILGMALDWASIDTAFGSASGNGPFDYFFTGGISWLLVVGVGVVALLLALGTIKPNTAPWPLILVLASALAALLMLIRIILGGGEESGIDFDRGPGMYVAFLAAIVSVVGAVMGYRAAGGDLNDLKDFNKIKGAFDRGGAGGSAAPPPPPPPPPPPAG
jgi:hypothetical protein